LRVGNFEVVATATDQRLDLATYREVGSVVGSYLTVHTLPVKAALRDALDEPVDPSQVLNTAVGFGNAVALIALSVAQDEAAAADIVRTTLRLGNGGEDAGAEVLILRLLQPQDEAPKEITGQTLVAIANYGDMGVRLTDQLKIPREALAQAISAAAARVS
jgi:hypothetical protein